MRRRSFFVRMLNALTASATASSAVGTAPVLANPDPVTLLNAADSEMPPWLRHWRGLSRHPIWESADPKAALLIHATERSQSVRLCYQSGTMPGEPRLFSPALVFRVGQSGALYVNGWCHDRKAHRTLRLDQITLESPILS